MTKHIVTLTKTTTIDVTLDLEDGTAAGTMSQHALEEAVWNELARPGVTFQHSPWQVTADRVQDTAAEGEAFWREAWGTDEEACFLPAELVEEPRRCEAIGPVKGARCSLPAGHVPASHVVYGKSDAIVALWMDDQSVALWDDQAELAEDPSQCNLFGHEPDVTHDGACAVCGQPAAAR